MGEYFIWANLRKREFINTDVFDDYGFMWSIASTRHCKTTNAACAMINGPWSGDPVAFIGDYWNPQNAHGNRAFMRYFDGHPYDEIVNSFEDVTGYFLEAQHKAYVDYSYQGSGDPPEIVYAGPFTLEAKEYRYAVNLTRREYLDRSKASTRHIPTAQSNLTTIVQEDLIPFLYGPRNFESQWYGRWCFDLVEFTNSKPDISFVDITNEMSV